MYKKFGRNLTIWDQTKRDERGKPTRVAQLVSPKYGLNLWDFKTSINTKIPALYAETISLAYMDKLTRQVSDST